MIRRLRFVLRMALAAWRASALGTLAVPRVAAPRPSIDPYRSPSLRADLAALRAMGDGARYEPILRDARREDFVPVPVVVARLD